MKIRYIYLCLILGFFALFVLKNRHIAPGVLELELSSKSSKQIETFVAWDTGRGFSKQEGIHLSVSADMEQMKPGRHRLKIINKGRKHPDSNSNEVWIGNIASDAVGTVSFNELLGFENAIVSWDRLLLSQKKEVVLESEFSKVDVTVLTHSWSGYVELELDGRTVGEWDLYSPVDKLKVLHVSGYFKPLVKKSLKVKLPQYGEVKAIALQGMKPKGNDLVVEGARLICRGKTYELPIPEWSPSGEFIFDLKAIERGHRSLKFLICQFFASFIVSAIALGLFCLIKNVLYRADKTVLAFAAFIAVVHTFCWLAFYPSLMSWDSFYVWAQTRTLMFDDWHPFVYNFIIFSLSQLIDSPAFVAALQLFVGTCLAVCIFDFCIKKKVNRFAVGFFVIIYALSPIVAMYNIVIWKDIPFTQLVVLWSFIFYAKHLCGFEVKDDLWVVLAVVFSFTCVIRHNGIVFIPFLPLVMYFVGFRNRKMWGKFAVISLSFFLFFKVLFPAYLGVKERTDRSLLNIAWKVNPIAAMVKYDYYTATPEKDDEVISYMIDKHLMKENYYPASFSPVFYNRSFNDSITPDQSKEVSKMYYRMFLENFPLFLKDRNDMMWSTFFRSWVISNDLESRVNVKTYTTDPKPRVNIKTNTADLSSEPLVKSSIYDSIISLQDFKKGSFFDVRFIFANMALAILIVLLPIILYKWFPSTSIFSLVVMYQVPFVYVTNLACDFRYLYFVFLASFFVIPLMLSEYKIRGYGVIKYVRSIFGATTN